MDAVTWQALGATLTAAGLLVSALLWVRRGPLAGLRGVAWSLLPLAAALTGLLRLAVEISDAVLDWALRLVFSPLVWLGFAVAGVSLVLFVVTGVVRRRRGPAAVPRRTAAAAVSGRRSSPAAGDFAEVEELLRRRGIS